jgi:excisionase family DNA binding protein
MASADTNPIQRAALTLRAIEREYHVSRAYLSALVRSGELPAIRRGRALVVLRSDLEAWWRREALRRLRTVDAAVEKMLVYSPREPRP